MMALRRLQLRQLCSLLSPGLAASSLTALRQLEASLEPCMPRPAPLWKYDSALVRAMSTAPEHQAGPASLPSYEQLRARAVPGLPRSRRRQTGLALEPSEAERLRALLRGFGQSPVVRDQALALYVNAKLYERALPEFLSFLLEAMDPALRSALLALPTGTPAAHNALFPYFAQWALDAYTEEIRAYREVVQTADLRQPHLWFPMARALDRRVIYHAGPTNSGKTYSALQAMRAAQSGVYCGPLRLLAMEVYDSCNAGGTFCSLVTGQERRVVEGARHTACTVEMVDMSRRVDVAVLDEIQMIGDESRGWAWTRALVGAPANELHVCGDGSAIDLVRGICEQMGEKFEVRRYDRFTSLEAEPGALGAAGYRAVRPGDCIVAFSRKDIYSIKQLVEQESKHQVCVVYGGLPPETRQQQAKLFNDPASKYRIMVASDAVGMGLNLNIGRIIFHSLSKYDGTGKLAPVSASMIKQIAGRAGRRSSTFGRGLVATASPGDMPRLRDALATPLELLPAQLAGLFPEYEHLEVFAGQRPDAPFRSLLGSFGATALLDSAYFFCKQDSVQAAADLLAEVPLSLKDSYNFCTAPSGTRDLRVAGALLQFASRYAAGKPATLRLSLPRRVPECTAELKHLETAHQVIMMWLWLSYRFDEESFPGRAHAEALAAELCELMDKGLHRISRLSKGGKDVSEALARHEHENVLESFSDEAAMLAEARQSPARDRPRGKGGRRSGGGRKAGRGVEEGEDGFDWTSQCRELLSALP